MRDSFYASPQFPRLLDPATVTDTVAQGVTEGLVAYVGKSSEGSYEPFIFKQPLTLLEVEISEDMYILKGEVAEEYRQRTEEPSELTRLSVQPSDARLRPGEEQAFLVGGSDQFGNAIDIHEVTWTATGGKVTADGAFTADEEPGNYEIRAEVGGVAGTAAVWVFSGNEPPPPPPKNRVYWEGEVPHQKWTNFYMKVLTRLASSEELSLKLRIQATPDGGATDTLVEELKTALRALGLDDGVEVE